MKEMGDVACKCDIKVKYKKFFLQGDGSSISIFCRDSRTVEEVARFCEITNVQQLFILVRGDPVPFPNGS